MRRIILVALFIVIVAIGALSSLTSQASGWEDNGIETPPISVGLLITRRFLGSAAQLSLSTTAASLGGF